MRKSTLESWIIRKTGCQNLKSLKQWQIMKLKETAKSAKAKSSFYKKLYQNIDLESIEDMDDLRQLPFTNGDVLAENPNSWACLDGGEIDRIVTLKTSGTMEKPKRIFFTEGDQALTVDFFAEGMKGITKSGEKTMILMPSKQPGSIGDLLSKGLLKIGCDFVASGPVKDIANSYRMLQETRCTCLVGIPVQVLALAQYGSMLPKEERVDLKAVLVSADTTPQSLVDEIKHLFGCDVFTHFGMTETGLGGAVECEAHNGCHIRSADLFFEIINPNTGQNVSDGESGEIVFSTLNRQAMPFIRYRTGDRGMLLSETCTCGSWIQRLLPFGGRIKHEVILPGQCQPLPLLWLLDEGLIGYGNVLDIEPTLKENHLHILLKGILKPEMAIIIKRLKEDPIFSAFFDNDALKFTMDFELIRGFNSTGMEKRILNYE